MPKTSSVDDEQIAETYRSMVTIGTEAIKTLQLINGGAIVALLAYLGQVSNRTTIAPRIATPVLMFLIGLVLAMLTFLTTYLTQYTLFNESFESSPTNKHRRWLGMTMLLALASVALFGLGSFQAVEALSRP